MSTSDSPRGKKAKGGRPRRYMIVPVGNEWVRISFLLIFLSILASIVFVQPGISALERWGMRPDDILLGWILFSAFMCVWPFAVIVGARWLAAEAWLTIDEKGMTLVGRSAHRRTISWSQPIKVRKWVSHYPILGRALIIWEFSQGNARIPLSLYVNRGIFGPDQRIPAGSLFRSDMGFLLPFPVRDAKTLELIKRLGDLHFVDEE